jgi:hypothetical protein
MTGNLSFGDNNKVILGAGSDLQIYHSGSASFIDDAGGGDLNLRAFNDLNIKNINNDNIAVRVRLLDGSEYVELHYAGSAKLATSSTGIDVTGRTTTDNATVGSGTASTYVDLTVNGASTANYGPMIELQSAGTAFGKISSYGRIQGGTSTDMFVTTASTNSLILGTNNTERMRISSTGIDVTGTVTADGLTVDGNIESLGTFILDNGTDKWQQLFSSNDLIIRNNHNTSWYNRLGITYNGDISFYEDTGTTAKFFWNASAERLGLGTSSPQRPLHLSIGTDNTAARFESSDTEVALEFIDTAGTAYFRASGDYIKMGATQSDSLTILDGGNVGIGTSSINRKLEISGNNNAGAKANYIRITDTDTSATANNQQGGIEFYTSDSGNENVTASIENLYSGSGAGSNLTFNTAPNGASGVSERMRIDSSGNVGIGTDSPLYGLHVQMPSDGSTGTAFRYIGGTNNPGLFLSVNESTRDVVLNASGSTSANLVFNTTSERMRIDSSGNVGIGTTNPFSSARLQVRTGTNLNLAVQTGTTDTSGMKINAFNDAANANIPLEINGSTLLLKTGETERMRIDASGNLLVGKTTSSIATAGTAIRGDNPGLINSVRNGVILELNRLSTDGAIVDFFKDGTTVGSIGTVGSDLYIGSGGAGLRFYESDNSIIPCSDAGVASNGAIDIGDGNFRFKDLYLSGGVYLGGTGSANKLDDYEEGTFTVTFPSGVTSPTYVIQDGSYVKIGKLVTFQIRMELSAGTANGSHIKIGGLPFTSTSASSYGGAFFNYSQGFITDIGARTMHIGANGTLISFYKTDGGQLAGTDVDDLTSTLLINGQYEVA